MLSNFVHYFNNFLNQLYTEIEAYPSEESLWLVEKGISNSGGNLCLHLTGNLNHFVGAVLGNTGYIRNRPLEFSAKGIPKAELLKCVKETQVMMQKVLHEITDLQQPYPDGHFDLPGTIEFQLFRLLPHLSYHVGQINYHRRLLGG